MMPCVTHAVIFVGIVFMEKTASQFSVRKWKRILMTVSAIVMILNADYMNLRRMISE